LVFSSFLEEQTTILKQMTDTLHIDNGLRLARQEKYDEAIDEFTSLLSQDHTCADALYYRGCAYLRRCKYDKAINDFNSAISSINLLTKHELPAFYKRGYAHFKTNQFDSALDDYRHYLSHCKNHKEQNHLSHKGLFQIGVIYTALNEYDSAVSYFDQAIKDSAGTEEDGQKLYYLHRGRAYACCAKYDEAQTDLQLVVEQSTDPFIKGCAYNELGQHQNALKEFDNLLQSHGNKSKLVRTFNDHILFRRGLTYGSLHLHDHALSDFHYALDYSEQQGSSNITDRILFRKGMSHMALNNSHQALIDFNQSTKLNENQSDVFYARGMLHYTLGRHNAAVYDQRKAMELERKSSTTPVLKTIYYANKFSDNRNIHVYYQNKIHEEKELLKKNNDTLEKADIHRMIAEYLQKQASYSDNPLSLYESARGHLKEARKLNASQVAVSISLVVNNFCIAQHFAEKYPNGNAPKSAINEYIKRATESILEMSRLFEQCVITRDWSDLVAKLRSELEKSKMQRTSNFDTIRNEYIINQVQKAELMQTAMYKFLNSPGQQEFYGLLIIRLCNLFDGIRVASAGIFSHSLEGTMGKVSSIFTTLGVLFEYVPIGSQYVSTVFGICGSALKKLDETRIENALDRIGTLGTQTMFNETADEIATELTIMYENQIKRFLTTAQERENEEAAANNDQQDLTTCSKCANCCKKCTRCCSKQKAGLLNEAEQSIMKTIVEYGTSIFLGYITRVKVKDIVKMKDIHNAFVNEACRPSEMTVFYTLSLSDKIKPVNPEKDDEHWDTYDFYRQPAIMFKNGTIRAQKKTDMKKFGCRKPTTEEEQWLKTTPEELDKNGFKITIDPEN
jgi:tetratricopeptide (TPR) repeat protein